MDNGPRLPRWLRASLWIGGGLLVAMPFVLQDYAYARNAKVLPWSWTREIVVEAFFWYLWMAALPLLAHLVRRFPVDARRWATSLPVHAVAACVLSVIHLAIYEAIAVWAEALAGGADTFGPRFVAVLGKIITSFEVFTYGTLVACLHAIAYARRYREEALRAAELEAELVRSQLEALKMQLQPHFLFNTLHAISALMYQDVDAADRMIARLSGLLRAALQSAPRQQVSLRQELEFLEGYLEIEKARLGDRLVVAMDIAAETLDASVPNLVLQPLVENAIRHGVAPRRKAGHLEVSARRADGDLEIVIRDDGPGLPAGALKEGVGLGNVRARMLRLYGPAHRFELRNGGAGGLTVELALPFQVHRDDPAGEVLEHGEPPRPHR
jgi:two-component system LytT family sensor kinase